MIATIDTGMMMKELPSPRTLPRPLDLALLPKPTRPSVPLTAATGRYAHSLTPRDVALAKTHPK